MRAGQLRERVTIQSVSRSGDGGGGSTDYWADTVTVWARVESLTGREGFEAMQVASQMSHRVTIRHRAVTPQQRVKRGTRILRIQAVREDERGESTELLCLEEHI